MPELPEVETMRRGVAGIAGATIIAAERTPCAKRPIQIKPRIDHLNKRVAGVKIASVDRLGKRVVIRMETGDRIIMEPRMTGLVLVTDPPTDEHLRFRLRLKKCKHKELLFWDRRGLGQIALLSEKQYQAKLSDGSLGPDALEISRKDFPGRFNSSRREVKVALLEQSRIAGIGNIYASEILHLAHVHPQARCDRLSKKQWDRIFEFTVEVLETAIRHEGSTLSDGTYRNALNDEGSYQNEHRVYDRAGETCPSCGKGNVLRIVQAQRSTFYCKACQKKR
ncbi:bifunctional DNA-formamidopyrimidine glycosylase/DNA-(apurinic or apyrimidinic site) lyase [Mariniblastus fucicola]|uniref:Formamidopyrimidine-DNA glycosylase n=1 Tax=Mariniblastus fucicola TaxID=980251 RepID=A0A5B9P7K9_9BACT|nr:bifunctional DNA-formamidopyrimidine glycosylase/DNA-(apurinic or apyrimidinic site) lyase [Mariniblastus fucicola]QEG20586.1 Formamidopyrimidine-DNA glycosylase [Mariniblastus fucicola]